MNIEIAHSLVVRPTLEYLGSNPAGTGLNTPEATLMLIAIGLVESNFRSRVQAGRGFAHGFWQFEVNGGCAEFETSRKLAFFRAAITDLGFAHDRSVTWTAIAVGADHLACIMARAVLWLEPAPLPNIGDVEEAYRQYLARWRPGKPSMARFMRSYQAAKGVVSE